ncbi:hypothetical protein GGR58DRAFT_380415 [Xylaria digitata]|nr:hypothetical protein GGR58DRAFT_380415 [Xylaria digitata]
MTCIKCRKGRKAQNSARRSSLTVATPPKRTTTAAQFSPEKVSRPQPLASYGSLRGRGSLPITPVPVQAASGFLRPTNASIARKRKLQSQQEHRFQSAGTPLRHGQSSQNSPRTAQARRDRVAISRKHRVQRRAGRDPSLTPSVSELRALADGHDPNNNNSGDDPGTPMPPSRPNYFTCATCRHARANARLDLRHASLIRKICLYCSNSTTDDNLNTEMKWCFKGRHKRPRIQFIVGKVDIDLDEPNEKVSCRTCLRQQEVISPLSRSTSRASSHSIGDIMSRLNIDQPLPAEELFRRQMTAEFQLPDPVWPEGDINIETEKSKPALRKTDIKLLDNFHQSLTSHNLQTCQRC